MKSGTILHTTADIQETLNLVILCVQHNITFEFMNDAELYFYIYDEEDFLKKQSLLGDTIINERNFIT